MTEIYSAYGDVTSVREREREGFIYLEGEDLFINTKYEMNESYLGMLHVIEKIYLQIPNIW